LPSVVPSIFITPVVGCINEEQICNNVVFPAPLGPSTTQRCPSKTCQSSGPRITRSPLRTLIFDNSKIALIGVKDTAPNALLWLI